jgi:H+-translocating NAD(P) transhydrogenase subunit alpha
MNKRFKFLYQNGLVIKLILFISFVPGIVFAESEGTHTEPDYIGLLFVFILSTFIGLGVVTRVSRLLHTPLMSLTNAISAIAVVGSLILTGHNYPDYITVLGGVALFASMTNIVSGFLITDRMLKMFKSKETKKS